MTTATLNKDQLIELKKEFVEFKLNEMTHEDMYQYLRDILINDVNVLNQEELEEEINSYDDFLYEKLVSYVLDEEDSYEILQEFFHERHENDWVND